MTMGRLPFMTIGPVASWNATTFWLRVVGPRSLMKSWPRNLSTKRTAGPTASTNPMAMRMGTPMPPRTIPTNMRAYRKPVTAPP